MLKLQTEFIFAITGCLLVALFAQDSQAQEIPKLEEHQKSVALFDFRVNKLLEQSKEYGGAEALSSIPMEGVFSDIKLTDVKRLFGAASLPKDMSGFMVFMGPPPEEFPLEFFLRVEFNNADALEKLEAEMAKMGGKTTINGQEYLTAPQGPMILAHRIGETTFEIGTKAYCLQAKRDFFTDRLKAAFKSVPNDPARIVIDLESRAALIAEVVALGKQQMADPVGAAYLDLIDNAKSVVLTQGMGEKMVTLLIEGVDENNATELKAGLDSALGTLKIAGGPMLGMISEQMGLSDETSSVAKTLLEQLAAKQDGTTVSVVVEKPKGFKEAMIEFQTIARAQAKKAQRQNNFRQAALGALNFESAHREFPFRNIDGFHDDLSWRVKLLPFIEQGEMLDQIDKTKGPTEKPNTDFVDKMPKLFGTDGKNANISWIQSTVTGFGNITDGSSNTIMLIENPNAGPWLKNDPISVEGAMKLVADLKDGEELVIVMYDGSSRMISNKIDQENLKNLLQPADGNIVNRDF